VPVGGGKGEDKGIRYVGDAIAIEGKSIKLRKKKKGKTETGMSSRSHPNGRLKKKKNHNTHPRRGKGPQVAAQTAQQQVKIAGGEERRRLTTGAEKEKGPRGQGGTAWVIATKGPEWESERHDEKFLGPDIATGGMVFEPNRPGPDHVLLTVRSVRPIEHGLQVQQKVMHLGR